jgi:prolyl oligopeptidase
MLRWTKALLLLVVPLSALSTLHATNKPDYPSTKKDNVVEKLHGVEVADPYRWLENADSPATKEWTEKQNALTRGVLDKLPGRDKIHDRLNTLLEIGTLGTPSPVKGKYFYTKRDGKQNQAILYVREGLDGKDRVLVDPNALAADGTVTLDWWFPSRDASLLAYGLSSNGNELSTLHVLDVKSGKELPDTIERTRACSLAWLPDSKGFYYTHYPKPGDVAKGEETYHRHVFFHQLGDDPAKDKEVWGKGRPKEDWPTVTLSPDGRWLFVTAQKGWARNEVFFKDRFTRVETEFAPLVEKVEALFHVTARNDRFYVRTNHEAPRYRVFEVDPAKPGRKNWREIIPEGKDVLEGFAAVGDYLIGQYSDKATSHLTLFYPSGKPAYPVKLPPLGSVSGLGGEWDGSELFIGFQSFTVPMSVYRYDLKKLDSTLWGQVKADIDFDKYTVEQVTYQSKDKTPVTMFLAHKKGIEKDGSNPTLLTGYGGFNNALTPTFNASRFLFLERGGVFAIANLRGGSEYGEDWHKAGMLDKKQNVFDDFLAAAEWLIREKYTSKDKLAIQGGSNGGLLVGAALTQRPDLFKAVVCQVPLLDMVRYHKFLIARLWIAEYGSPDDAQQFKWLYAYSPYHHVKDGTAYPATLLMAAESDTRVDALHARKMAARLQAATSSDAPILLRIETKAGHGAGKPRAKVVEELTDVYSFLFWQLGMKP